MIGIAYRTERVVPIFNGFEIVTRAAPNAHEVSSQYDADRRLQHRKLPIGHELIPATTRDIRTRWPVP